MGRLEQMQVFVRIVEAGSISRAATQLYQTKSAVSKALSGLEAELGVKLLARTTRTQKLTDSGQLFYEQAKGLLPGVEALYSDVAEASAEAKGKIRISAPLSFGIAHLSAPLKDFMLQHPKVELEVIYDDGRADLVEDGFDLAIRIGNLADSQLQARRLCPIGFTLCASPEYIAENSPITSIQDLAHHPFLKYSSMSSGRYTWTTDTGETSTVNMPTRFVANNGDALLHMAEQGLGITAVPHFIGYKALQAGRLVPILPHIGLPSESAYAVYPQSQYLPQRTRLFIDFLVARFAGEPYWEKLV